MSSTRTASPCFTRPRFELGLSSRDPQVSAKRARPTYPSGRGSFPSMHGPRQRCCSVPPHSSSTIRSSLFHVRARESTPASRSPPRRARSNLPHESACRSCRPARPPELSVTRRSRPLTKLELPDTCTASSFLVICFSVSVCSISRSSTLDTKDMATGDVFSLSLPLLVCHFQAVRLQSTLRISRSVRCLVAAGAVRSERGSPTESTRRSRVRLSAGLRKTPPPELSTPWRSLLQENLRDLLLELGVPVSRWVFSVPDIFQKD